MSDFATRGEATKGLRAVTILTWPETYFILLEKLYNDKLNIAWLFMNIQEVYIGYHNIGMSLVLVNSDTLTNIVHQPC